MVQERKLPLPAWRTDEAICCYDETIRIFRKYPKAPYNKRLPWQKIAGNETLLFYDGCLGMNMGVAVVMTNKTVALTYLGLNAEAEELFRQALDLDPNE